MFEKLSVVTINFRNKIAYIQENVARIHLGIFTSGNIDSDLRDFSVIIAMTLIFNVFYLSNFSISIDDEVHAIVPSYRHWLSIGRYTAAILDRFLFPQPVIPYTPYLFFSLCSALSYFFVIKAHNITKNYHKYFTLPVFVTYPLWQLITGFDSTLPAISVGLVSVTLAGLLFERTRYMSVEKTFVPLLISMALQTVFIAIAIGAYQSFLLMYLTISFGIMLVKTIADEKETLQIFFQSVVQISVVSVLSLFLYHFTGTFARWVANIPLSSYLNTLYISSTSIRQLIFSFFSYAYSYYSGDASKFGVNFPANEALMLLSALFITQHLWRKNVYKKILGILLWLMVVLSPFLFVLFSIAMPSRSLFPLAYVAWLMAVILLKTKHKCLLGVNSVIISLMILQSLNINGLYTARSLIAQRYDSLLAADIYNRLGSEDPNFDRTQPVFIDVYGTVSIASVYPNPSSGTLGVSFFEWDGGNLSRIVYYMRLMGYSNIERLPDEQRLALTPEFEKMPVWPATGCVKKVGSNIYLIKLSNLPDVLRRKTIAP